MVHLPPPPPIVRQEFQIKKVADVFAIKPEVKSFEKPQNLPSNSVSDYFLRQTLRQIGREYPLQFQYGNVVKEQFEDTAKETFAIVRWDQQKHLLFYGSLFTKELYAVSIADLYIADYELLKRPAVIKKGEASINPLIFRERLLSEGIAFVKESNNDLNKISPRDAFCEEKAVDNKIGLWKTGFLKTHASVNTIDAAKASIGAIKFIKEEPKSVELDNSLQQLSDEISLLNKSIQNLKNTLQVEIDANNQATSSAAWWSFASVLMGGMGVLVGALQLKKNEKDVNQTKEKQVSNDLNFMQIEAKMLELQLQIRTLKSQLDGVAKHQSLNHASAGFRFVGFPVQL